MSSMKCIFNLSVIFFAFTLQTAAAQDAPVFMGIGAQAGLFAKGNKENLPKLTLSAGEPLLKNGKLALKSGRYYEIEIEADGSQELALAGSSFFRAIWIDEIVINGIEIRPLGIDSIEFDEAGKVEISFIAIKPGAYFLGVPSNEEQIVEITIE